MECEVIVVGAGVGGLTTAALLAARGANVCLFERQSQVGGCVANFEHLGYSFEPTFGLYSGWEEGGTWERVFAKLPLPPPDVTRLSPTHVVRLPNGRDIPIASEASLEDQIVAAFPDCTDAAVMFLRQLAGNPTTTVRAAQLLETTSREFRWFIDAQLQAFAQCTSDQCSSRQAAAVLRIANGALWSIDGGADALANQLANSFTASGGSLRLDSPVLRLAYGGDGTPIGVDLLSGERVIASRAIVSNLTVWDTYGKLIGPSRTPRAVASELKKLSSWGAYLMFLGIDAPAGEQLPAPHTLVICESAHDRYEPEQQQLMLNLVSGLNAPEGKRALTATAFTKADEWFSFHEDHSWHEEKDQALLETWWARLHETFPQLGNAVEVIETSTPQTIYEASRRRLGMIGVPSGLEVFAAFDPPFANVFLVGDTVSAGVGLEGVAESARLNANRIACLSP